MKTEKLQHLVDLWAYTIDISDSDDKCQLLPFLIKETPVFSQGHPMLSLLSFLIIAESFIIPAKTLIPSRVTLQI